MEETKDSKKKLSYEELTNFAMQMQQKAMVAEQRLQNIDMTGMRLHYLFEVIKYANKDVFSPEFMSKCIAEVEDILAIKEEETNE